MSKISILDIFRVLIGRPTRHPINLGLEMKFHKEANPFGEHGTINVSHAGFGLRGQPVRFVFVGKATPPQLDLNVHRYIVDQAEEQGYVVHHIETYGRNNETVFQAEPHNPEVIPVELLRPEPVAAPLDPQATIDEPDLLGVDVRVFYYRQGSVRYKESRKTDASEAIVRKYNVADILNRWNVHESIVNEYAYVRQGDGVNAPLWLGLNDLAILISNTAGGDAAARVRHAIGGFIENIRSLATQTH